MCGRFSSITMPDAEGMLTEVQRDIDVRTDTWSAKTDALRADDVRPGSQAIALAPNNGTLSPIQMLWGLPASWAKGKLLFNTRFEKATGEDGIWPPIADRCRCLVPATRFWEHSRMGGQIAFTGDGRGLVMMAGVFLDGRMSLVTTAPAPEVAPHHDRMPLCLTPAMAATWLSPAWRQTALVDSTPEIIADEASAPTQMSLF